MRKCQAESPAKSRGVRSLTRLRVRLPGPISPSGIESAGELAPLLGALGSRPSEQNGTHSLLRGRKRIHEPYGVVGEGRRLLLIAQLRQLGDACLIVIDSGGNHVRGSFGTQQISELA